MSLFERFMSKRDLSRGVLLIAAGVAGMLVSAFADLMGAGQPGFGMRQLSGFVIGGLVAAAGLVRVLFPGTRILVRLFAGMYVSGMLYVGLRPNPLNCSQDKILLDVSRFFQYDFAINTMGFIPLGYLLMLSFGNRQKDLRANLCKRALVAAGVGGMISLFLEFSQYFLIAGRDSNLMDLIANTLGTLLGIAIYLLVEQAKVMRTGTQELLGQGDAS